MVAAGVDANHLREQLSLLRVEGFSIDFETVNRSGLSATYARVRLHTNTSIVIFLTSNRSLEAQIYLRT